MEYASIKQANTDWASTNILHFSKNCQCQFIVSQVCNVRHMTQKHDFKFSVVIIEYDGTAGAAYIYNSQHLCQLIMYHIYSVFYSIYREYQPSIKLKTLSWLLLCHVPQVGGTTGMNKHAIDLELGQQPPYRTIYSLGPVELKILKIYIETKLANRFIQSSMFPVRVHIFLIQKPNKSLYLYVDY